MNWVDASSSWSSATLPDRPRRTHRLLLATMAASVVGMAVTAPVQHRWPWLVFCALAGQIVALLVSRRGDVTLGQVLVLGLLFRAALFWIPPVLSDDVYRYVWDGLLQTHGINPYRFQPADPALAPLHGHPVYERLNSAHYFTVYPPVSQLVFRLGAAVGGDWLRAHFVIKGIFALMEAGALLLLAGLAPARALVLYAWSPLVLIEAAGQGHTEAAAVFFVVLALWCVRRNRPHAAAAALAGAVWVKLYPVLLFPLLLARTGRRTAWTALALSVLLFLPFLEPTLPGNVAASLDLYVRLFEFNAGPYYALKGALQWITGADWGKAIGPAFRAILLGLLPLIYLDCVRRARPIADGFLSVLAFFLCLSTTVHPWYLLPLLALLPLASDPADRAPGWLWLAACSIGTYLLYAGGPYWPFVWAGWGGWALYEAFRRADGLLQRLQRRRGAAKARLVSPHLPETRPLSVLDLGAGEGYVGAALHEKIGAAVVLADVLPLNRTDLPAVLYDGRTLPFADETFDATLLVFVLHHAEDPRRLIREAGRVTRGRIVVLESVFRTRFEHRLLAGLDRLANRLRSGGRMAVQEPWLHFRTVEEWEALFREEGLRIIRLDRLGRLPHRQVLFVLDADGRSGPA